MQNQYYSVWIIITLNNKLSRVTWYYYAGLMQNLFPIPQYSIYFVYSGKNLILLTLFILGADVKRIQKVTSKLFSE